MKQIGKVISRSDSANDVFLASLDVAGIIADPLFKMLAGGCGYLLGSISPAYFLGKALKGIDVRDRGFRNAGARNVYHLLGVLPAFLTAIVDLGKGVAAVLIARRLLSLPDVWLFVPAWAAVLGHIFPFYLRFRGGKGMAVSIGIIAVLYAQAVGVTVVGVTGLFAGFMGQFLSCSRRSNGEVVLYPQYLQ